MVVGVLSVCMFGGNYVKEYFFMGRNLIFEYGNSYKEIKCLKEFRWEYIFRKYCY